VEGIHNIFQNLEPQTGNRWFLHTLVPDRFHLSVSQEGKPTIFVEGTLDSFGRVPLFNGIEHREDAVNVQTENRFRALRLISPDGFHGREALSVIAYEIARTLELEPGCDNTTLLANVSWILMVLGRETSIMSHQNQRGLVAELLLLRRLLRIGREHGFGSNIALDRWFGPVGGKRDFAASEISIEVKSTALNARIHKVASIDQLEPTSTAERAYLYSVGIKSEPTNDRKLPTYVADTVSEITNANGSTDHIAVQRFYEKLKSEGYERQFQDLYATEPGISPNPLLPAKLFRVDDLDRLRLSSFKSDQLPSMVTSVSYEINISATPLMETEADAVLLSLLASAAI